MRTSRAHAKQIVVTYAGALLEAAVAENAVDEIGVQIGDIVRIVRGHIELRDALLGGAVPAASRGRIVSEVFGSMNPALVATVGIMAERSELEYLSSVEESYTHMAEERRNMVAVEVTTVVELTDALREAIKAKLSADLGKTVVLHEKVDPAVVGGIIISTGGRTIDASIASQLEAAKVTLSTAPTGGDV